jgi:hypothetical protein
MQSMPFLRSFIVIADADINDKIIEFGPFMHTLNAGIWRLVLQRPYFRPELLPVNRRPRAL